VAGSKDIMRMTLGSATVGQLDGWREEKHPFYHDCTSFQDPGDEMITEVVRKKEKGRKTPAENVMTTALGVASGCIGELITIKDLDHTITEMGPTAQQEYSELQEADINVTTQDIFTQKDIRSEIDITHNNSDIMGKSTHQWAQIDGSVSMEKVLIPPIIRTALQQEGGASLAEGIQVEDNTRGDRDGTLEHLLDTVEEPRKKSHQQQSMGIANIGSPYVV
jgi:hypothetical protein